MFRKSRLMVSVLLLLAFTASALTGFADAGGLKDAALAHYENSGEEISSFWMLGALKGAGADLSDEKWKIDEGSIFTALGKSAQPTDYAGRILAALILGRDPRTVMGRDIVKELADKQKSGGEFSTAVNQHVWAMIALDAAKQGYAGEAAISYLGGIKKADGGYNYSDTAETSDTDMTAMALIALSNHKGSAAADALIAGAVAFLKSAQLDSAGFASYGTENVNTIATVISGLVAAGENVTTGDWIKGGQTMIDALESFALPDGSFNFALDTPDLAGMATVQALIALGDVINGKSVWTGFDIPTVTVNIRIEGASKNILHKNVTVSSFEPKVLYAIEKALIDNEIPYSFPDTIYGKSLASIGGEDYGQFGGSDGWMYRINGEMPMLGVDSQTISDGDEVLIYYGDYSGTLFPEYTVTPENPKAKSDIYIKVTSTYYDWDKNKDVTVNIEDAVVKFGKKEYLTGSDGVATIDDITAKGTYKVTIFKEQTGSYPAIVRVPEFEVVVASAPSSGDRNKGGDGVITIVPVVEPTPTPTPEPAPAEARQDYADRSVISDWALEAVGKASEYGIVSGTGTHFEPHRTITRAEFVTILVRLLKLELVDTDAVYSDVGMDDWHCQYVASAKRHGLVSGFEDNTFRPDGSITREEMATIIGRAYTLDDKAVQLGDEREVSDWARVYVIRIAANGIMTGYDGRFEPKTSVTREMAAVVAVRLYETYPK